MSRTLIAAASSIGAVGDAEAAGAQADLVDGFLAGDVEHALAGAGERGGGLQQQGGFADAGIAADQHGGGRHQAAAEHAVEFGDAGGGARRRLGAAGEADEGEPLRGRPAAFAGRAGRAATVSSAMVFHSPQVSQRPAHFGVTAPQDWQTKRVTGLAELFCYSAGGGVLVTPLGWGFPDSGAGAPGFPAEQAVKGAEAGDAACERQDAAGGADDADEAAEAGGTEGEAEDNAGSAVDGAEVDGHGGLTCVLVSLRSAMLDNSDQLTVHIRRFIQPGFVPRVRKRTMVPGFDVGPRVIGGAGSTSGKMPFWRCAYLRRRRANRRWRHLRPVLILNGPTHLWFESNITLRASSAVTSATGI